jgi:hypothetical protein
MLYLYSIQESRRTSVHSHSSQPMRNVTRVKTKPDVFSNTKTGRQAASSKSDGEHKEPITSEYFSAIIHILQSSSTLRCRLYQHTPKAEDPKSTRVQQPSLGFEKAPKNHKSLSRFHNNSSILVLLNLNIFQLITLGSPRPEPPWAIEA